MTAVAPPPNFQNISRPGWSGPNGVANGAPPMSSEDYRQMFMPRKSVQRANSSSSLASTASSSSTISTSSSQTNGVGPSPAGEGGSTWAARKKAPRGLWPASKTEPVSGISTARPQSIASASSGPSAASAMTALHSPSPMVPSQHNGTSQAAQNGAPRPQGQEASAFLHLILNGTLEQKTITVPFFPDVLRIGRQTNNKTIPTPHNGYFDSKVLSRQHAEVWADRNGKIWIRDVKSSNGTFVNGQRLSQENRESEPHELREQDKLELGIDIVSEDQKTIVHHKVAAHVEHAGIYANAGPNMTDMNFGELENGQLSGLMGPGGQQQLGNMRSRTASQGPMNGRLQGPAGAVPNSAGGLQQPRQPNFWLQPVTMEQVVKKLNSEINAARQQSKELQHTSQYINSILSAEPKKEVSKPPQNNHVKVSPIKDIKTRFSEPPAPPPQQPLPEKPDAQQPSLRRTDTERPNINGSPSRSESKSASLENALAEKQKELETTNNLVRDLKTLIDEERRAREDAEERANRLEQKLLKDQDLPEPVLVNGTNDSADTERLSEQSEETTLPNGSTLPNNTDVAANRLQQRLDSMMAEMNEMKQQMEKYRQRAEDAEAESATNRKTLAEMVEKIREEDAMRTAKRRSRSDNELAKDSSGSALDGSEEEDNAEDGEITIINERDVDEDGPTGLLRRVGVQNGRPTTHEDSGDPSKAAHALATRHSKPNNMAITHGAPAVSILTVVALGVALMAWLNNAPKVER